MDYKINSIKLKKILPLKKNVCKNKNISTDNLFVKHYTNKLYSFPICALINNNKIAKKLSNINLEMMLSKKEMKKTEDHIKYYKSNYFQKRNQSSKTLNKKMIKKIIDPRNIDNTRTLINSPNNIFAYTAIDYMDSAKSRNLKKSKSSSQIYYPYSEAENHIMKKKYLNEIEKRGNFYNKIIISSLQRTALNFYNKDNLLKYYGENFSDSEKELVSKDNGIESYVLESPGRKKFPKMKKYLINKLAMLERRRRQNIFNFECECNPQISGSVNVNPKKVIKLSSFKNKFHFNKTLDNKTPKKPYKNITDSRVRDWKIMVSISKINDPDIIQKYKSMLFD